MLSYLPAVAHALGLLATLHVLLTARTPQAAIAWSLSMVMMPYLAVPAYLLFGQDRFHGYVQALRAGTLKRNAEEAEALLKALEEHRYNPEPAQENHVRVLEKLARLPFTEACHVELLIDGEATYARLYEELEKAREYILVLYFIVNDDPTGRRLLEALCRKAREGVRVYFVFDEMGSQKMTKEYLEDLRAAGIQAHPFNTTQGWRNRLQLNFRNHRKIVVVDGKAAWVGGVNVQDDSLGKSEWYGPWRDTHLKIQGPAVQSVQLVFAEDYHWATNLVPPLIWDPQPARGDTDCVYLASGPADEIQVGLLFFLHCIGLAQKRLWIATPYFVPDTAVMEALHLAALRGVDVRVILPDKWDFFYMYLAAWAYLPTVEDVGIQVYRYGAAYTHQKVMLIDDEISWVGSSNVDNRSMALNFEGNAVMVNRAFAAEVERMLLRDLGNSRRVGPDEYNHKSLLFKLGVNLVRLFSPML